MNTTDTGEQNEPPASVDATAPHRDFRYGTG